MEVVTVLWDFVIMSIFLILGYFIREKILLFQKLFIPSSVLGGTLMLITGPQVLGIIEIPKTISQYPGVLIIIILAALVLGIKIDRNKIKSYLDYSTILLITYGALLFFGVGIEILFGFIWNDLPPGWGLLGVFAFYGGHGTSAAAGTVFEKLNRPEMFGLGMVASTAGLIISIALGMVLVNWGLRKGYCTYVDKPSVLPPEFFKGIIPEEKREPTGTQIVSSSNINSLALQFVLICLCIGLGWSLRYGCGEFIHPSFYNIPNLSLGIIGAVIIWPLMIRLKVDYYVDKKNINNMSGFALEFLIIAAISTIPLNLASKFWLPLLIMCIVLTVVVVLFAWWLCPRLCKSEWFEKMLMVFGVGTGSTGTALALVRSVDPDLKNSAPASHGVGSSLLIPIWVTVITVGPSMAVNNHSMALLALGAVIVLAGLLIGKIFFSVKR